MSRIKELFLFDIIVAIAKIQETTGRFQNISKVYKLYDKSIDRLRESLSLTKKKYHKEFYALSDVSFEAIK